MGWPNRVTHFSGNGRRATKDEIIRIADQFGLGSKTGIDLPDENRVYYQPCMEKGNQRHFN